MHTTTPDRLKKGDRIQDPHNDDGRWLTVVAAFRADWRDGVRCLMLADDSGGEREVYLGLSSDVRVACGFCREEPVLNAASWISASAPAYAACPRCGSEAAA